MSVIQLIRQRFDGGEDTHIANCHSTPNKNEKVQNLPYDVRLTELKDT